MTLKPIKLKKSKLGKSLEKTPLKRVVYLSIILAILNFLIILLIHNRLPPEVPLFYGLAESDEQLTSSLGLTIPAIISVFIITINVLFVLLIKNKFLQQTLILTAFVVTLFLMITSLKIALLVGNF